MSDRVNAGTMTIYRRNRRFILSVDKSLKIFSAFMIPLFISMLTVFIAIYQQKIANDNRSKDLVNLEYQRRLDLSANEQRRTEDSIANAKLRLADRQERENQLKKDREMADFQRQMDINFTRSKLEEEKALEEHIRLMEEEEREKYSQLAHSIKQEDILLNYVRAMSNLIGNSKDSITSHILYTIRWKTLAAIRELDSRQKTLIFNCLHEIGLLDILEEENRPGPLNLTSANFDHLDLSSEPIEESRSLSFHGISLINANLDHSRLPGSDFSFTQLIGSSFQHSILNQSTFHQADLTNSSFIGADLRDCDFTNTILIGSDITANQLRTLAFLDGSVMPDNKIFIHSNLLRIYGPHSHRDDFVVFYMRLTYYADPFDSIWNLSKDESKDPDGTIFQKLNDRYELRYEASTRYRISMISKHRIRIPHLYDKWIKNTTNIFMRIKYQCGNYEEQSKISLIIYLHHINQTSPFVNYSFGPIKGNPIIDRIDFVPVTSIVEFSMELIFERSNLSHSTEYIAFCQDIHISIVKKH